MGTDNDYLDHFEEEEEKSEEDIVVPIGKIQDLNENVHREVSQILPKGSGEWHVSVSEPEICGEGMGSYLVYPITVFNRDPDSKKEYSVYRRYSDFEWIRNRLASAFRGLITPPLPEKDMINRFEKGFITHRRKELEKFLTRVLARPEFLKNEDLRNFLEVSDDFEKRKLKKASNKKGFLSTVIEKVSNIQASIGKVDEVDEWFDAQKEYFDNIENQYYLLLTRSNNITKGISEISQLWSEFSLISKSLSESEEGQDDVLSSILKTVSDVTNQITSVERELTENRTEYFDDSLRDWERLFAAIRIIINNRLADLWHYQTATKNCEHRRERVHRASNSISLNQELANVEAVEAAAKHRFERISKEVKFELENIIYTKRAEMITAIRRLAQSNMNYHLSAASLWKEAISKIEEYNLSENG